MPENSLQMTENSLSCQVFGSFVIIAFRLVSGDPRTSLAALGMPEDVLIISRKKRSRNAGPGKTG
jgi:hypothetical protein